MADKGAMVVLPSRRFQELRIIIVDDHHIFRDGLKQALDGQSDLKIVGEAQDGQEALEQCHRLRPDLVLMDIVMPEMDGLAATRAIKSEFPRIVVLIMTAFDNPNLLEEALRAGASGYIIKDAPPQRLINAIRRVLRGESPLNQEVAMQLLLRLIDAEQEKAADSPRESPRSPLLESLTLRELDVLQLLARGQSNQDIAQTLLISVSTAKKHIQHIIAKLGVSDRTQAAVRAIELGLFSQNSSSAGDAPTGP